MIKKRCIDKTREEVAEFRTLVGIDSSGGSQQSTRSENRGLCLNAITNNKCVQSRRRLQLFAKPLPPSSMQRLLSSAVGLAPEHTAAGIMRKPPQPKLRRRALSLLEPAKLSLEAYEFEASPTTSTNFSTQQPKRRWKNKRVASTGGSKIPVTQWEPTCASTVASSRKLKIRLINDDPQRTISDIKLKRTVTTLDLSQKAEDVC
jgi:hypothetical protein